MKSSNNSCLKSSHLKKTGRDEQEEGNNRECDGIRLYLCVRLRMLDIMRNPANAPAIGVMPLISMPYWLVGLVVAGSHSNIAKIYDAGTTEAGLPFFVMELVDGIPVTKFCDENQLNIEQRLKLFLSICEAIQHAHQKGIIHRDIKPANILVGIKDETAFAKVIDFGLVKALDKNKKLSKETQLTELGNIVGTLQYMSPEQTSFNSS